MDAKRAEGLAEGRLETADLTPAERAIETLVRKSVRMPGQLAPTDLEPLFRLFGVGGTFELVGMLGFFHFINRIADLVGIRNDMPLIHPRWRLARILGIRMVAWMFRKAFNLENLPHDLDGARLLHEIEAIRGAPLPLGYRRMQLAPGAAASICALVRVLPSFDPEIRARVETVVGQSLPQCEEESTGFHPRPPEPLDALVFVGTRYAARTTDAMVDAVRAKYAWDDPALTDLFYLIAVYNALARLDRLLGTSVYDRAGKVA